MLGILAQQSQGKLAHGSEVVWCTILAHPAVLLAEDGIKHPMQTVLDAPMTTRRRGEGFGDGYPLAADVEGTPGGRRTVDLALPRDHADAGELGPVLPELLIQPGQVGDPQRLPGFDAAMAFLDGLVVSNWQGTEVCLLAIGEEFPQGARQFLLIILDGQKSSALMAGISLPLPRVCSWARHRPLAVA